MITIHDVKQGTDEWDALRAACICTGSVAHLLLRHGMSRGSLIKANSFKGNYHTKRGHILESEAIDLYEQITREIVNRPGFVTNSKWPRVGYSPDGLTDSFVIEVKCFAQKKHLELYGGDIPLEVLAQVHFGMMICEKPQAKLVIYNPKLEPKLAFKLIDIKANKAIQANFKRILSA